jgi:hypothetical protein
MDVTEARVDLLKLIDWHRDHSFVETTHSFTTEEGLMLIFWDVTDELDQGICLLSKEVINEHRWYLV